MNAILLSLVLYIGPAHSYATDIHRPDPPGKILRRLKALTASAAGPNRIDFGDPSAPDFSETGVVRVYTTGGEILVWRDKSGESATERFLRGVKPGHERLNIYHSDRITPFDPEVSGEDAWDPTVTTMFGKRILFAGAMKPTGGRKNAVWPDDHWNRRTYAFEWDNGRWIMNEKSMWGDTPSAPTWIGHNYGHHIFQEANGATYMFYERVSEEKNGHPWKTEIFARAMDGPFELRGREIPVLRLGSRPWPATQRHFGGFLAEGPRVFKAAGKYMVAFSAGEYTADDYGIHLLWADRITGPYHPYLNASGRDLYDFGREIEAELELTWGAGRPAFFQVENRWWVLFHGIERGRNTDLENGKRAVYLAPVRISARTSGAPLVRVLPRDE